VSLELALDSGQAAIGSALEQFCAERCGEDAVRAAAHEFPLSLWRELAELGVLALATPEGDGGALELVAAFESLGRALFPGPLAATVFATQLLSERERAPVVTGDVLVSVGAPPVLPWAPLAGVFLATDGERAWRGEPRALEPLDTLGGEPWARGELEHSADLGDPRRALSIYDLGLAAYLTAAGDRLLEAASEHARTRVQFGRAIGEFQAVAHPLAECRVGLDAAATLARAAAFHFDHGSASARGRAAGARLSAARAALQTAFTAHQIFGAVGITLEGPVFHVSRRIQQLVVQPPLAAASQAAVLELFDL
jgi:alkylation response protein AidB-like acyl-CoA dehydrogenase